MSNGQSRFLEVLGVKERALEKQLAPKAQDVGDGVESIHRRSSQGGAFDPVELERPRGRVGT